MAKRTGLLTVRIVPEKLLEFHAACDLDGVSMSGLLHQYIVKFIREVETRNALLFQEKMQELKAEAEQKALLKAEKKTKKPRLRKVS